MMIDRLMDLVVLVAEMSQSNDKIRKDLDKELAHLGYSSDEIEQAMSWISAQWRPIARCAVERRGQSPLRILSPWEAMAFDAEAYGYLLRLQNLGIVDGNDLEKIMTRCMPYGSEKLSITDVKSLAGSVVFNMAFEDTDEGLFDIFDDDFQTS